MKDIRGRTAIVTGASRGIGTYVAQALAAEGMNLVLAARTQDGLEALRSQLMSAGHQGCLAVPCDVTRDEDLRRLVDTTEREFGAIDVLVNNAGVEGFLTYHKLSLAEIGEIIDVNLRATMHLSWLVLPRMVERNRGHIVNMSSLAGKAGRLWQPCAATKGA
jgi:short-subunit dehydrogenase